METLLLMRFGGCEKLVAAYGGGFDAGRMFCFGGCLRGLDTCVREHKTILSSLSLASLLLISGHTVA